VNGDAGFVSQLLNPVLQLQLAPLQFSQFEIIRSGVGKLFLNFLLQRPVQVFEFSKIRLNGHGEDPPVQDSDTQLEEIVPWVPSEVDDAVPKSTICARILRHTLPVRGTTGPDIRHGP
jgi:hypothetical protein